MFCYLAICCAATMDQCCLKTHRNPTERMQTQSSAVKRTRKSTKLKEETKGKWHHWKERKKRRTAKHNATQTQPHLRFNKCGKTLLHCVRTAIWSAISSFPPAFSISSHLFFYFYTRRTVERASDRVKGFWQAAFHSLPLHSEEITGQAVLYPQAGKFKKHIGKCEGFLNERWRRAEFTHSSENLSV